jgi:hypothetical protein
MEVEFTLTLEDYRAFQRYHAEAEPGSSHSRRFISWIVWVPIGLITVFLALASEEAIHIGIHVLLGALAGAIATGFGIWRLGKLTVKSQHARFEEQARSLRLSITPEAITIASDLSQTSNRWPAVCKIGATDDYAFLYTAAAEAYVVPRRAFRDRQHFDEFVELARRYQEGVPRSTGITTDLPGPGRSTAFTRDVE